jgi:hypothetical protein
VLSTEVKIGSSFPAVFCGSETISVTDTEECKQHVFVYKDSEKYCDISGMKKVKNLEYYIRRNLSILANRTVF